jgi:hypothetical protein
MLIDKLVNFIFNHKNKLFLAITILSLVMDGPPVGEFIK